MIIKRHVGLTMDRKQYYLVQVPGSKKWRIFGVGLTHLVESGEMTFFLEVDIVGNIFQWDILKTLQQLNYDGIFLGIRPLTVHAILKTRPFVEKSFKTKALLLFSSADFIFILIIFIIFIFIFRFNTAIPTVNIAFELSVFSF